MVGEIPLYTSKNVIDVYVLLSGEKQTHNASMTMQ